MQKVRLETLREAAPPANHASASIPGNPGGVLLPASDLLPTAPMPAYALKTPLPSPLAHLNRSVSEVSSLPPDVLVIDDSLTIRKIVETALHRAGYAVLTFSNGIEALRWLAEVGCLVPKLVLLDIELPKIDGYELARMFKANPAWAEMTILMISQRDGVLDRLKGRLVGAKSYLTKPFQTEVLVETVRQYLGNPGK